MRLEVVHVVGGGSQNELLCQLTADACGLPVVAGPTEAAALGNVLVQARTLGEDLPDLAAMRDLVRRTQPLTRYEPSGIASRSSTMRVALLVTCLNDALFPDAGKAVVTLLRRLGVDVEFPEEQTCCGQPMVNTGYLDEAVPTVRTFVRGLRGVRRGGDAVGLVRRLGPPPAVDRRAALG